MAQDLAALDAYLLTRSYVTGYKATADDAAVLDSLVGKNQVDPKSFPNVFRYQKHLLDFTDAERKAWPQGDGLDAVKGRISSVGSPKKSSSPKKPAAQEPAAKSPAKSPEKPKASASAPAKDEDEVEIDEDDDLFGDDNEEDRAAAAALQERLRKQAEDIASGKVKATQRSLIVLDIKPFDEETDLQELAAHIKSLTHQGIQNWGDEHKFVEIAYGM